MKTIASMKHNTKKAKERRTRGLEAKLIAEVQVLLSFFDEV